MTEETGRRIALALEIMGTRLLIIMIAIMVCAGQLLALNLKH